MGDANSTPSTASTAGTASAGRPAPKVSEDDDQVAVHRAVDGARERVLQPAAKIVTNTTSPTPIISAAAVTAVRPVLRVAFSRASLPGAPRAPDGQPTTRDDGPHDVRREQRDADEEQDRADGHAEQQARDDVALARARRRQERRPTGRRRAAR